MRFPGGHFKSCRFITVMRARLKVPAKNSPALLFLSRGKTADCCCFSFFFFSPAEEEQSRGIFGGNFQTRLHDGNKAAGLKVTTWFKAQKKVANKSHVKALKNENVQLSFAGWVMLQCGRGLEE